MVQKPLRALAAIAFASDSFGRGGLASLSFQTMAWGRQSRTQGGFPKQ